MWRVSSFPWLTLSQVADGTLSKISDRAMGPNKVAGVSERVVTGEPMYVLVRRHFLPYNPCAITHTDFL